ncbi:MAG: hypothetical protein IVW54_18025 [Candidatus Binataceae bacterium]|jgi:hypothetical protein|nr:hypothetical protein [Candidatus Binataceae bacterium]
MKNLKEQNPIVLMLAIVGIFALLYSAWSVYHQHIVEKQERAIMSGPPQVPGAAQMLKPSTKPPPQ